MSSRHNKESQGGDKEYQFEGGMSTILIEDGKPTYADRFQGTTGWNPISPQMGMDILAINIVKRWQGKFSKYLHHDLKQ